MQENNIIWHDRMLDELAIEEIFGRSAEKIGERIAKIEAGYPD